MPMQRGIFSNHQEADIKFDKWKAPVYTEIKCLALCIQFFFTKGHSCSRMHNKIYTQTDHNLFSMHLSPNKTLHYDKKKPNIKNGIYFNKIKGEIKNEDPENMYFNLLLLQKHYWQLMQHLLVEGKHAVLLSENE